MWRMMLVRRGGRASNIVRTLLRSSSSMMEPPAPGQAIDAIPPPVGWKPNQEGPPLDPDAYMRGPVSSAHAIVDGKISARDSATIGSNGQVVHGRYGELQVGSSSGIPLEYLALLRHAAEGAAALRVVLEKSGSSSNNKGTLLVYGASQPDGFATLQLASSSGQAVVGVVGGEHSGNADLLNLVKTKTEEPGVAVAEEYAIVKQCFKELVEKTVSGDDPSSWTNFDPDTFLTEFKENLLAYTEAFPEGRVAVPEEQFEFFGKEKDRKNFRINMDAYLSHLPGGAPAISPDLLDKSFTLDQYAAFKNKFGEQTASVITGDDVPVHGEFNPPVVVRDMVAQPEAVDPRLLAPTAVDGEPYIPYEFSVAHQSVPPMETKAGGPIVGAIISVTPDLKEAAEFVEKAGTTKRAKAEALSFLPNQQRNAFAAASSVAQLARQQGMPVVTVGGSLPGLESVGEPTDVDVQEALAAMELDEMGESRLNYYIQVYRANDYPFYADYAVHRATEVLSGPRQIIVTK
eukprot:CAMPEP_0118682686 /NCGR_PEP_ID=MMETSP0800-20121206/5616_1 /TAXON_ID=210618 ORGANISM="Striatella unipunctata, Strain CCMP2910" /NCGR_SAMPLE_ID=MMETSP0800 /ASSEMBLY_ACC=CAM_ASM_000638 /LENGTH=515 /DNA_ID=CAMNT_0006579089 /DNA_START=52 /DNA_END=1599 /DNA_ORIENTATION=+